MVKLNNLQKLNYGESSQTPQREFTSESDRHVNEPILSINNLKVNTNTMTPTNQGLSCQHICYTLRSIPIQLGLGS